MQAFSVKQLVFSSSATIYGFAKSNPIPETAPLSATNLTAEQSYSLSIF